MNRILFAIFMFFIIGTVISQDQIVDAVQTSAFRQQTNQQILSSQTEYIPSEISLISNASQQQLSQTETSLNNNQVKSQSIQEIKQVLAAQTQPRIDTLFDQAFEATPQNTQIDQQTEPNQSNGIPQYISNSDLTQNVSNSINNQENQTNQQDNINLTSTIQNHNEELYLQPQTDNVNDQINQSFVQSIVQQSAQYIQQLPESVIEQQSPQQQQPVQQSIEQQYIQSIQQQPESVIQHEPNQQSIEQQKINSLQQQSTQQQFVQSTQQQPAEQPEQPLKQQELETSQMDSSNTKSTESQNNNLDNQIQLTIQKHQHEIITTEQQQPVLNIQMPVDQINQEHNHQIIQQNLLESQQVIVPQQIQPFTIPPIENTHLTQSTLNQELNSTNQSLINTPQPIVAKPFASNRTYFFTDKLLAVYEIYQYVKTTYPLNTMAVMVFLYCLISPVLVLFNKMLKKILSVHTKPNPMTKAQTKLIKSQISAYHKQIQQLSKEIVKPMAIQQQKIDIPAIQKILSEQKYGHLETQIKDHSEFTRLMENQIKDGCQQVIKMLTNYNAK